MDKLRTLTYSGAAFVIVFAAWAFISYEQRLTAITPYAKMALLGLTVPAIPRVLAYLKLWTYETKQLWEKRGSYSFERGSIFVSESPLEDPEGTLDSIVDAVATDEEYDSSRRDEFPEGPGLTITHTGFHNSFVRVTDDNRLLITGASLRTHTLANLAERVCSLSMRKKRNHPMLGPKPVRGAPRSFLGVFLVVLILFSASGVTAAAYPSDTYNASERAVLVGFDARADFVPGYTETDATLGKAAFLVDGLSEEAVEIAWDKNTSAKLTGHARQSKRLSMQVRTMLTDVKSESLSPAQRQRVERIEQDLHSAERRVAETITKRLETGKVSGDTSELEELRDWLRNAADRPVGQ